MKYTDNDWISLQSKIAHPCLSDLCAFRLIRKILYITKFHFNRRLAKLRTRKSGPIRSARLDNIHQKRKMILDTTKLHSWFIFNISFPAWNLHQKKKTVKKYLILALEEHWMTISFRQKRMSAMNSWRGEFTNWMAYF